MARIIGAVAASHTPAIGFAYDRQKQNDPVWKPIFEAFRPVQQWLAGQKPDVLFVIYNDHVTSFFFDHYSAFALGVGDSYAVADEGGGVRDLPPVKGHTGLAHHIGAALVADEFDMSFFQGKPLDHGCFSPLSMMWPHEPAWPGKIVPLQVGVLQFPVPSALRCYKLGQSLRKARVIRKTSRSRWWRPAACRTRCTASAPASTTRRGISASSTSSRRTRSR